MANNKEAAVSANEKQVSITRVIDAPRQLVFEAWTDPQHLLRWYAPDNCTFRIKEIEVVPGGRFLHCIHNPKFGDCWCKGVYHEIVEPERIVFSLNLSDENGNDITAAESGHDHDWPGKTMVTVTLLEFNGKTKLILDQNVPEELAKQTGAYPSWLQMLDKLENELKKDLGK